MGCWATIAAVPEEASSLGPLVAAEAVAFALAFAFAFAFGAASEDVPASGGGPLVVAEAVALAFAFAFGATAGAAASGGAGRLAIAEALALQLALGLAFAFGLPLPLALAPGGGTGGACLWALLDQSVREAPLMHEGLGILVVIGHLNLVGLARRGSGRCSGRVARRGCGRVEAGALTLQLSHRTGSLLSHPRIGRELPTCQLAERTRYVHDIVDPLRLAILNHTIFVKGVGAQHAFHFFLRHRSYSKSRPLNRQGLAEIR